MRSPEWRARTSRAARRCRREEKRARTSRSASSPGPSDGTTAQPPSTASAPAWHSLSSRRDRARSAGYLKKHFDAIRYLDLVFNGGTVEKAAWVLPCAGETEATGTLAAFLSDLGIDVTEKNLDESDEDDDDDNHDDEEGFIEDEGEEDYETILRVLSERCPNAA